MKCLLWAPAVTGEVQVDIAPNIRNWIRAADLQKIRVSFVLSADYFLTVIEGNAPPAATVAEALSAELVALAALKSLKIGAEVPLDSRSSSE